jgi:cell division septation protein DedD
MGWGICLSFVMFGFGFLAGAKFGEQEAADRASRAVVRPIPPHFMMPEPEVSEPPISVAETGKVWKFLDGQESSPYGEDMPATGKEEVVREPETLNRPEPQNPPSYDAGDKGSTIYSVQVAASKSRERAEALKRELAQKDYPLPRVLETEIRDQGIWYRIRVGRFERKVDAEQLAQEIRERERQNPMVVVEGD